MEFVFFKSLSSSIVIISFFGKKWPVSQSLLYKVVIFNFYKLDHYIFIKIITINLPYPLIH